MTNISKIKNKYSNILKLIFYLTIYLLVFFVIFRLLIGDYFQIQNDNLFQYEIFYKEWIKIIINFIKTGKLNTYSFNMFLGTDFYSSMGYYCTGDIFLPILLIFRNNISLGLLIETILCIYISAITMSLFLHKRGIKNNNVIIFISFLYALGGQAILYVQNYMFHRYFSFLPLLFLGVEYFFQNKKRYLFIFSIAILFMQNYYFMYMTLIFLFFYTLIECLSNGDNFKAITNYFFKLFVSIIIGFFISCIITLPAMISVVGNVTSRESSNNMMFWELKTIIGLLSSMLYLNPQGAIVNVFNLPYDVHGSWYNLFITIIPLAFVLLNLNNKKNRKRNILLISLFVVALIKPANIIMHGFSFASLRWVFLLEFYLLYLSALYMDQDYNIKHLLLVFITIIITSFVFIVILYLHGDIYVEMKEHLKFIGVSIVINIIIVMLFKYNKKISYILSIIFVLISTLFYYDKLNSHAYVSLILNDEIGYNQNYDKTYYRYYNSYLNSYDCIPYDSNSSLLYNIMTTSTYSSTYDTAINKFLSLDNNSITNYWNIEISNPEALTMLGTKYYIIGDRMKDQYSSNSLLEYKYTLRSFGEFEVYYNKDYRGFGYCAENIDYLDNYKKNINDQYNFINTIYVDDNSIDISKYKDITYGQLIIDYIGENKVNSEISINENNILLIPFPNNKGWSITVNGKKETPISVNGGFIGLQLNKGLNKIEMIYNTPYLKAGIILSCIGLVIYVFVIMKEKKRA